MTRVAVIGRWRRRLGRLDDAAPAFLVRLAHLLLRGSVVTASARNRPG